jgi:AcrR family transcriptional regulator
MPIRPANQGPSRRPTFGRVRLDKDRIVEAAGQIADSQGLEAVTASRLAEALRVKPASLYRHLANIDVVRDALAARALTQLIDLVGDSTRARTGRQAIQALAHAQRTYAQAHPGRYLAATRWGQEGGSQAALLRRTLQHLVADLLAGYQLAGDEALEVARCMVAALQGVVVLELSGAGGAPFEADQCYQRLLDMLDAGARSAARAAANRRRAPTVDIRLRPPETLAQAAGL